MSAQLTDLGPAPIDHLEVGADPFAELRRTMSIDALIEPSALARQLNGVFGAPITGRLAGYQDPKIAYRWARTNGSVPAEPALRRLYAAARIWSEVTATRSHTQAIAWFVAPHPQLDERQPLEMMIQDRYADVADVAHHHDLAPAVRLSAATTEISDVTALWHDASLAPLLYVVRALAERFGAPSVSLFAGCTNAKAAYRWVKNEGKLPAGEGARLLYGVYRVVVALEEALTPPIARAWFFAANRALDERSPLDAAREGNVQELIHAANRLLSALNPVRNSR